MRCEKCGAEKSPASGECWCPLPSIREDPEIIYKPDMPFGEVGATVAFGVKALALVRKAVSAQDDSSLGNDIAALAIEMGLVEVEDA